MTKVIISLIALSFSGLVSAATCQDLFSDANANSSKARQYANQANTNFALMKKLATDNASDAEICDAGQMSRMGAMQSARFFRFSRKSWLEAINVCSSPNDKTAADQADLNTGYFNTQAQFVASMDNLLGAKCGLKPLTPLLNTIDN